MYAEDTQLFYSCLHVNIEEALSNINTDLSSVISESFRYLLVVYCHDFLPLQTKVSDYYYKQKIISDKILTISDCARNVDLYLDCKLRFKEHVSHLILL